MARKITEQDLANVGVIGLPDVPGLTAAEMQRKLEETSRAVIIPRFNELVDEVANVGDAFSEWKTYEVGDYCIYENVLYRCNTDITTAGAWDESYWTATSISAEIGSLRETISDLEESLADGMTRITAKLNDLEERIPTIVLDKENQTAYITTNQE